MPETKKISVHIGNAIGKKEVEQSYAQLLNDAMACDRLIHSKKGKGSDFLGWVHLPSSITEDQLADIQETADRLAKDCTYVVVIGIGGSYLGAKAVIEALSHSFSSFIPSKRAKVLYAGNHISEDYLYELLEVLNNEKFGIINISKSGTTTEPAIAFRLLKNKLEQQEGKEFAQNHIIAITDAKKGALRTLADQEGYKTYIIPDDVGGRFSVLTPVGLLPIAVAGFDIRALVQGAKDMEKGLIPKEKEITPNDAEKYAATRLALHHNGKDIEILANFHPKMHYITEWWKQLYGESEGKDGKGIFPAGVNFTTDLHSMGQWIQDGRRSIFETVISIEEPEKKVEIPADGANLDGLNFIAGKRVDYINKMAEKGTLLAHLDGNVPNIHISLPRLNEYYIGQLFYFFEKGVAISGYLSDVNPFDQPGVEAYKNNMFALLDKPGYESASEKIKKDWKN